ARLRRRAPVLLGPECATNGARPAWGRCARDLQKNAAAAPRSRRPVAAATPGAARDRGPELPVRRATRPGCRVWRAELVADRARPESRVAWQFPAPSPPLVD